MVPTSPICAPALARSEVLALVSCTGAAVETSMAERPGPGLAERQGCCLVKLLGLPGLVTDKKPTGKSPSN
jgi:hypothetical protein